MKFISPHERPDKLINNESHKSELIKKQKWSFISFLLNSSALYQIGMRITQYYLSNDRLPLRYYFLLELQPPFWH
jgi:hypothetical protein